MAKLSPSFARVWLHCPKAASASEAVPFVPNEYTTMGSYIHLRAASELKNAFDIPQLPIEYQCDDDGLEIVNEYVAFCQQIVKEIFNGKLDTLNFFVEEKISMADIVHEGNGVIDFVVFNDHTAIIIDLKTGFDMVYAKDNPQLILYGLGMRNYIKKHFGYNIQNFYLGISQPRRDNNYIVYMNSKDLDTWYLTNQTNINLAYNGEGRYTVGTHCEYCHAKGSCKHYLLHKLEGNRNGKDK